MSHVMWAPSSKAMPAWTGGCRHTGLSSPACGAASTLRCGCRSAKSDAGRISRSPGSPGRDSSVSSDVSFDQPGPHVVCMTAGSTGQVSLVRVVV